jgi:hypothetical protein
MPLANGIAIPNDGRRARAAVAPMSSYASKRIPNLKEGVLAASLPKSGFLAEKLESCTIHWTLLHNRALVRPSSPPMRTDVRADDVHSLALRQWRRRFAASDGGLLCTDRHIY